MKDDSDDFITELQSWLVGLKKFLKGDEWEIDIMARAIDMVGEKLDEAKDLFLERTTSS